MPNALDPAETRRAQRGQMSVYAIGKPIAIQEKTSRCEQTTDRGIAREDFLGAAEIVQSYRRDRQSEWSSDLLRPRWIDQVGKDICQSIRVLGETLARFGLHLRNLAVRSGCARRCS